MMNKIEAENIPFLLHFEMSYACNQNCIFCYNPERSIRINKKMCIKILQKLVEAAVPHVYLSGGEPSLFGTEFLNHVISSLSEVSSITLLTNGIKYLEGISSELACIGIPIHGNEKTHNFLTRNNGYNKTIESIKKYIKEGFDVRCITVLTKKNYTEIYDVIKKAYELGMESIYIDRFEPGGLGASHVNELLPSVSEFKEAVTQMIEAKKDFDIKIGFGTAIPFCIDNRLIKNDLWSVCGAGVWFAAVDPKGNLRTCNQSNISLGNILQQDLLDLWKNVKNHPMYKFEWVKHPCRECKMFGLCLGGCRFDNTVKGELSIDPIIRREPEHFKPIVTELHLKRVLNVSFPSYYRVFCKSKYLKLRRIENDFYLIITRYHTVKTDYISAKIVNFIIEKKKVSEKEIIEKFKNLGETNVRNFLSKLIEIGGIYEDRNRPHRTT